MLRFLPIIPLGAWALWRNSDARKQYATFLSDGEWTAPHEEGVAIKEKHFRHPTSGHQVYVVPLPSSEKLKFYEDLLVDWWNTHGSQHLPLILLPGIHMNTRNSVIHPSPDPELFEIMQEDAKDMPFKERVLGGKLTGDPSTILATAEWAFHPSVEALGFPHIWADLSTEMLSPLAQVYLMNLSSTFELGTDLMPRDSPLYKELVDKRNAHALSQVQRLLSAQQEPKSPQRVWWMPFIKHKSPQVVTAYDTFVLPWHSDNCPGLVAGLLGLGYQEIDQKLRPISRSRLSEFLGWQNRQRDVSRELDVNHKKLLDAMLQILEERWTQEGSEMFPRLHMSLQRHLRAISATKELVALGTDKDAPKSKDGLR